MALTREKQELLVRLNEEAVQAYEAAKTKALERGREVPKAPEPLRPEDIDFPRHVYKKGTAKDRGNGLFNDAESKLVKSEKELAELGSGWCSSPAEAGTASDAKKQPASLGEMLAADAPEESSAERHLKKVK